ncbi:hypothetical protein PSV09DRAFT_2260216 [Bipolaris maydis]|nr:hypothetical protein J3E73DRAFT_259163 [Bipolaris maydis]KAJ5057552.1 hypothetical protein J3E74DRAFT_292837 [Bipolaris maydis]KAJ6206860.1 hypothetical protein PSV09DRAFT_2260216 [Bipolaris maydis]
MSRRANQAGRLVLVPWRLFGAGTGCEQGASDRRLASTVAAPVAGAAWRGWAGQPLRGCREIRRGRGFMTVGSCNGWGWMGIDGYNGGHAGTARTARFSRQCKLPPRARQRKCPPNHRPHGRPPPSTPNSPARELRADDDENPRWRPQVPGAIGPSPLIAGRRGCVLAGLYGQCAAAVITASWLLSVWLRDTQHCACRLWGPAPSTTATYGRASHFPAAALLSS